MTPTPNRIAHTSTELKKTYKQHGPRLSERQVKQLEREHELDQRAARQRQAEANRKAAKKRREEREERERAARERRGVGLATQLIGYSRTQAQLKRGMEAFVGLKKREEEEHRRELALARELETLREEIEWELDREPLDEDVDEGDIAIGNISKTPNADKLGDEELNDDALLDSDGRFVPDPPKATESAYLLQTVSEMHPPSPALPSRSSTPLDSVDLTRSHGPINRAIEAILDKLPTPLIELLSTDMSSRSDWDPAPLLLHKLGPLGLPLHRLRIKLGCEVILLRDISVGVLVTKDQRLRIVRVDSEYLECIVLDGKSKGTKVQLAQVVFEAKYRNDDKYPFKRKQFPIRVTTSLKSPHQPLITSTLTSKDTAMPPPIPLRPPSELSTGKKTAARTLDERAQSRSPGLPASKLPHTSKSTPRLNPDPLPISHDCWDDFLDSATQIARDLCSDVPANPLEPIPKVKTPGQPQIQSRDVFDMPISTQDLDFCLEDLDTDCPEDCNSPGSNRNSKQPLLSIATPQIYGTTYKLPHSALPFKSLSTQPLRRPPSASDRPGLKRKPPANPSKPSLPPPKRNCPQPPPQAATPSEPLAVELKSVSLADCGVLSSQEALMLFEDDEMLTFGTPHIAV